MKYFVLIFFLSLIGTAKAADVDTLTIHSKALMETSKCVVILPADYAKHSDKRYPVVFLLHGYSGDYANWIKRVPEIKDYADRYEMIIVCPDGKNSWYIDSKNLPNSNYESYVGKELPLFIDSVYRTKPGRQNHVITGLSMGGHGALYLAIRHPETFGAAGSMSGVLDLTPWGNNYGIKNTIGDSSISAIAAHSDLSLVSKADTNLVIKIDCGITDPFIEANRAMHHKLLALGVPHDYAELPGGHTWDYWRNSIEYHLLFFRKFFNKSE